jgi:hypothetical protein
MIGLGAYGLLVSTNIISDHEVCTVRSCGLDLPAERLQMISLPPFSIWLQLVCGATISRNLPCQRCVNIEARQASAIEDSFVTC